MGPRLVADLGVHALRVGVGREDPGGSASPATIARKAERTGVAKLSASAVTGRPEREGRRQRAVRAARFLFSPTGRLRAKPFAIAALAVLAVSYLVAPDPLLLGGSGSRDSFTLIVQMLVAALRCWMLAALCMRRAADANLPAWVALLAVIPLLDACLVMALCCVPSRAGVQNGAVLPVPQHPGDAPRLRHLAFVVAAGVALIAASVAVGALLVGRYGFALFVYTPFIAGVWGGYFANLGSDLGPRKTTWLLLALGLGAALALIAVALEGIVCILLAMPLVLPLMLAGGALGRAMATNLNRSTANAYVIPALLVAVLMLEPIEPAGGTFHTVQSIQIDAPPPDVWRAITQMQPIIDAPSLPFRLGVSYPVAAEVTEPRTGGTRLGHFSTGTAVERVTVWQPGVQLSFEVLSEPPSMVELSIYEHVHAPHVTGYFVTRSGTFRLTDLGMGRTLLWERTEHRLELEPLAYWLPLARWMVHQNNRRVLRHIERQAETARVPAGENDVTASAGSAAAGRTARHSRPRTPQNGA